MAQRPPLLGKVSEGRSFCPALLPTASPAADSAAAGGPSETPAGRRVSSAVSPTNTLQPQPAQPSTSPPQGHPGWQFHLRPSRALRPCPSSPAPPPRHVHLGEPRSLCLEGQRSQVTLVGSWGQPHFVEEGDPQGSSWGNVSPTSARHGHLPQSQSPDSGTMCPQSGSSAQPLPRPRDWFEGHVPKITSLRLLCGTVADPEERGSTLSAPRRHLNAHEDRHTHPRTKPMQTAGEASPPPAPGPALPEAQQPLTPESHGTSSSTRS